MLRSYTTVIRDSFRAAFKSKVLTIAIGLILLILLALAPFHLRESQDVTLSYRQHVTNPQRLVERLVKDGKTGDRSAVAHVWKMLSPELQKKLEEKAGQDQTEEPGRRKGPSMGNAAARDLVDELNVLLSSQEFYDEVAFDGKRLDDETKQLIEEGSSRSANENRRLNRLLLSTALRRDIASPKANQLDFYYFTWHIDFLTTNISQARMAGSITSQLPVIFDKFVMSIGIFIALLVTASIIPEMLEPGSLNLLLSKPVHRWALLVAKYLGGCVFILLCAGLFFSGIWLWMGIQLGIWEKSILLSIPVYVLVFAMYYSVSVLAGIWFRSPILSIVFAILFWGVCSLIGWGYGWLDNQHYNAAPRQMVATDDSALMVNIFQKTKQWDNTTDSWKSISVRRQASEEEAMMEGFVTYFARLDEFSDLPGPAFDLESNKVLIAESPPQPEGRLPSSIQAAVADGADNWQVSKTKSLPNGTRQIFHSKRFGWMAINSTGQILQLDMTAPPKKTETDPEERDSDKGADGKEKKGKKPPLLKGLMDKVKTPKVSNSHKPLSKANLVDVSNVSSASLNPDNDHIAVYSQGEVVILAPNEDGQYEQTLSAPIGKHDNTRMTSFVQFRGKHIFVAFGNSHFYLVNAEDLSVLDEQIVDDRSAIRTFEASPSGQYVAAVVRSGQLWVYDANAKRTVNANVANGDMLAASFNKDNQLWVGTRFQAAKRIDLASGEELDSIQPDASWISNAYRYVVRPLYRVFPKPGEFYKVISHLSASGDTSNNPDVDLVKLPQRDNPWSPLTSGLTFTGLMLLLSCIVFQRQDF